MLTRLRPIIAIILVLSVIIFSACSRKTKYDLPGFTNQGILPLSTRDAYNGANIFIAQEMEKSPYLYRFIESRGAPDAIEVISKRFEDSKVLLYYAIDREVYSMVADDEKDSRQWIVRGPFQMNWKDIRELSRLNRDKSDQPLLMVWGRPMKAGSVPKQPVARVIRPVIPPPPPPKPKVSKPKVVSTPVPSPSPSREEELLTLDPAKFKALSFDQQAIFMSKGYAQRASNGDILHTVKATGETLDQIARWYTKDPKNADMIAAVNQIETTGTLQIGTVIRVPIALAKDNKAMPLGFN